MKVAVISDIHDHIENLKKALAEIKAQKCQSIICCGDICAPFTIKILASSHLPTYSVFGNNDGDQAGLVLESSGKVVFSPVSREQFELDLGDKKIAVIHYPQFARILAVVGKYDAVFYGHDHLKNLETINKTILCNPGPVCGIIKGDYATASFAIFDTDKNSIDFVTL